MLRAAFVCLLALFLAAVSLAQNTILPRDVVALTCVEDPELNGEYTITDTGMILLQYIGAVEIQGLTTEQASAKIARELVEQQILRTATITIRLKTEARPAVQVAGAVGVGGNMPWRAGLRLSDALEYARPTSVADLTKVQITSALGAVRTVDATNSENNPALSPGDRVFIPLKAAGGEITVIGAVQRPGLIPHTPGMTISQAIAAAGGRRQDADPNRVTLRHAGGDHRVVDLTLPEADVVLAPGDSVVVPQRNMQEQVYVRGAIAKPGLISYRPGMTVSEVVQDSIPVEGARLDRVKLVRKDASGKTVTTTVNLAKVASGESQDEPLLPGDIVDVPYPSKSFGLREGLQVASLLLLIFWILR